MQSSKQTPSVIARLMGLDDLPSQPRIHKQHRVLSENYLRKTASIGQCEKRVLYSGRSYRVTNNQRGSKNGVEEEIPVIGRNSFQSISDKKVDSSSISTKMCSIKQQSGGAKHPLIEQRLHRSKEFDNVPEDLHFNQDKLLRYLQQPDLLLEKQLQGQQSHELHLSGHSRILNSSNAHSNRRGFCNISNKATTPGSTLRSLQKLENDTLSGTVAKFDIDNLHKQLISQSDLKAKTQLSSTRIVVLKPNSRKPLISERSTSLPGANGTFLSGDRKNSDFLRAANEEESNETTEKERRTNDLECSRQNNTALEKFDVRSAEVLLQGEECSSEFESKLFTSPSQRVNNLNNIEQNSYSSSNRSDLAMLAKRQIFERWKTTKSFEEGKFASERCTLGEMLDISDMETNPKCLSNKLDNGNLCSLFSRHNGKLNSVTPFGISSKVGGKVEKRILPQSKLHLQHFSSTGSRIFRARSEASHRGRLLRQQEADDVELNNKGSQSLSQKCNLEPKDSIIIQEKPQFSPSLNLENQSTQGDCVIYKASSCCNLSIDSNSNQPLKVSQVIQDEIESSFGRDDMSGNTGYFPDVLNSSIRSIASCVEEAISVDAHSSDIDISSEFKELHFDPMPISLGKDDDTLQVWETSDRQESLKDFHVEGVGFSNSTGTGPVFQMNLTETNQTSPNSVLDPPFQEENVYIFQGFDSAAADFYSPPKRLQLQMSDSEETCSEGTGMAVSSDEDTDKESVDLSQDPRKLLRPFQVEESRNSSYVVDVLDEAGFTGINLEIGFGRWHSLEFPVSPSVFEALEKKYGKQTSWKKSERRLLFDQINAGLKEILNLCNDVNKWAKPLRKRFHFAMRRDEIEEDLWSLLISEEKEACKDLSEKALGMETKWLQLSEEIHEICRDIENDLFDELVGELAATEEFIE